MCKSLSTLCGFIVAAALMGCAPGSAKAGQNYSVKAQLADVSDDNAMAYLVDFDANKKLDSVLVKKDVIEFKGSIDQPILARIMYNGKRGPVFVLEPGKIAISSDKDLSGTPLNNKLEEVAGKLNEISSQVYNLPDTPEGKAKFDSLYTQYKNVMSEAVAQNANNPVGLFYFIQTADEMDLGQLQKAMQQYPALSQSHKINSTLNMLKVKDETSVGKKYKDFTVPYQGKDQKFSDYLNKDGYTLVDFWASWCGPCIRATKTLKELNNQYGDKGLKVVGVAVWDEPDATLKAIKDHELPWPSIINAQKIPTDIYGIQGIPCILLIGPDGTILSRDKQGEELIQDVKKYLEPQN